MNNRPDPETFARYSYYLAYASSAIILLSLIFWIIPGPVGTVLSNMVWLALVTGIAGTFMALAARSDFKRVPASEEAAHAAKFGLRLNLLTTVVVILFAVIAIAAQIMSSTPIKAQP